MTQTPSQDRKLIPATIALLGLYDILYWITKFFGTHLPHSLTAFYEVVKMNWWIFVLLEFLGVASVFIDFIVRYDHFQPAQRTIRLILTVALFIAFVLHLIFGILEMYIVGKVQ